VTSLRNWGLEDYEIATTLSFVVAQRLVRRLCPDCRYEDQPTDKQKNWLQAMGLTVPDQIWHASGCEACQQLGYKGRTGIFEVWPLQEDDWNDILAHKDERTMRHRLADKGHRFLLADAVDKAEQGITSIEELRQMSGVVRLGEVMPKQEHEAGSE
jgi:general secretion pathway protein E